jgi:hypothetical protein
MDAVTEANREAWEAASRKHIIRPGQAAIWTSAWHTAELLSSSLVRCLSRKVDATLLSVPYRYPGGFK